jgi:GTP pyrophosphokinase
LNGRKTLKAILEEAGIDNKEKALEKLLLKYSISLDELHFRIGEGSIAKEIIYRKVIAPDEKENKGFWQNIFSKSSEKEYLPLKSSVINPKEPFFVDERLIYIDYFIPHCCNPVPGDDAIIYKNNHEAMIIHQTQCKHATHYFATQGRMAATIKWMDNGHNNFPAKLIIKGQDRLGLIRDITELISKGMDMNMYSINITIQSRTRFLGEIILFVKNRAVLDQLIERTRKIKGVEYCVREIRFELEQ